MLLSNVLGVIIIARNGDRHECYQDPNTYAAFDTETTALGVFQSHNLGSVIRSRYLDSSSSSYIEGIHSDLVENSEVMVRIKAGVEGTVVFDSALALLQGMFPPNPNNKITLANGDTVVAPLGGYQYVHVETVEPDNDRSLESWTNCPAFQKHINQFYSSEDFKTKSQEANSFFQGVEEYVFGRTLTLENSWNIFDYIHSQLIYNQTYAYRLPPTFIEQARHWANYHEAGVFSSPDIKGIGNIAGRTLFHTISISLERIVSYEDPLKLVLLETTYQAFVSFLHQTGITKKYPELQGIPEFASAIAIEVRRGPAPELRDFLRIQFKNGTTHFKNVHVFDHKADIPLTEFIYRTESAAITNMQEWKDACSDQTLTSFGFVDAITPSNGKAAMSGAFASVALLVVVVFLVKLVKRTNPRIREAYLRLEGDEILNIPIIIEKRRSI